MRKGGFSSIFLAWSLGLGLCAAACSSASPVVPDAEPAPDVLEDSLRLEKMGGAERVREAAPRDTHPSPDLPKCGNGKLDTGEKCDPKISKGKTGYCPASDTECDDDNVCTTDTVTGTSTDCSAACSNAAFTPCCGNGTVESGEECDDGNTDDKDACSSACKLPGGHLLVTEVAVSPTAAEFVEIFNPSSSSVSLDGVYLSDRDDYYKVVTGSLSSAANDFVAAFPSGSTLAAGAWAVVSIQGATSYKSVFGKNPDYELVSTDTSVPDMKAPVTGGIGSAAGLTDTGELVVLFSWDGKSDLVKDLDYVAWKTPSTYVYKTTTTCVDGPDSDSTTSCFVDDTSSTSQSPVAHPTSGGSGSIHRCDYLETGETKTGGNGAKGHDETSEPLGAATGATFKVNASTAASRTPGAAPPKGFCP
jgi:cysteine-rich repeat protein